MNLTACRCGGGCRLCLQSFLEDGWQRGRCSGRGALVFGKFLICFSFKFYDSALWGEEKPFYFEDYNGKTDLLRKFSNKSREAILIDLQKEVEAGKVIML